MWKRLSVIFTALRGDLKVLWFALQHPASPSWLKLGTAALLGYFLLPIDIIPDFIPVIGYLDDVVIITLGVKWMLKRLPEEVLTHARARAGVKTTVDAAR